MSKSSSFGSRTDSNTSNNAPNINSILGHEFENAGYTEEVDYGPRLFSQIHGKQVRNALVTDQPIKNFSNGPADGKSKKAELMAAGSADQKNSTTSSSSATKRAKGGGGKVGRQPITESLIALLEESALGHLGEGTPNLKEWLAASVKKSYEAGQKHYPDTGILDVKNLDDYFDFVDEMVQHIPHETRQGAFLQTVCNWHWPLSQRDIGFGAESIQHNYHFAMWMTDWADAWGTFLNGPDSATYVQSFLDDPDFNTNYKHDDYIIPEGGFQSFNEFFCREVYDHKRPIASPKDHNIVASPADSVPQGVWPIGADSMITATNKMFTSKGIQYSVKEILGDRSDDFAGGIFTHTFLNVYDYHRYRVPVAGEVVGIRQFTKNAAMPVLPANSPNVGEDLYKKNTLVPVPSCGFQFTQTRSMVIIDTAGYADAGLVVVMPMGMAMCDSCNVTLKLGQTVAKGDELGYFLFGGSDFVLIFQKKANFHLNPDINVKKGQHILARSNYGSFNAKPARKDSEILSREYQQWSSNAPR